MATSSKNIFVPLLDALNRVQAQLERGERSPLMVAMRTMREFKKQQLPVHCNVLSRKIIGVRVPMRGRVPAGRIRLELARWPQDDLLEGTFASLLFVIGGQADIRVANYVVRCQSGDMLLIPSGVPKLSAARPHYEEIMPQSSCDLLMITPGLAHSQGLECSICHSRGAEHIAGDKDERCWVKNHFLSQLFEGFVERAQNAGSDKSTFYLLNSLLLLLCQEVNQGGAFQSWEFSLESSGEQTSDPIDHAKQYMKDHLDKPITIDIVARQIGFSRSHFTRLFREKADQSFKSYLTQLRLEHASALLREANLPVNTVSRLVGLSPGQLRFLFHLHHNCSPNEFRHIKRNPN